MQHRGLQLAASLLREGSTVGKSCGQLGADDGFEAGARQDSELEMSGENSAFNGFFKLLHHVSSGFPSLFGFM